MQLVYLLQTSNCHRGMSLIIEPYGCESYQDPTLTCISDSQFTVLTERAIIQVKQVQGFDFESTTIRCLFVTLPRVTQLLVTSINTTIQQMTRAVVV